MENKKDKQIRVSQICFFMFAAILFFAKGIGWVDGEPAFKVCMALSLIFWIAKMLLTDHAVNEFLGMTLLLAVTAVSYRMSGEKGILVSAMVITGVKGIDLRRQFKMYTWIWAACCLTNIVLCFAGITIDLTSPRDKFGTRLLSCNLGFPNHSVFQMSYMAFAMMFVFAYYKQMNTKKYVYLFLGNVLCYMYSLATTGFLCCTAGLLFSYLFGLAEKKDCGMGLIKIQSRLVLPVCLLFSLAAPFVTDPKVFGIFDSILNGRLNYSRYFMTSGNFTPFGCRIYEVMSKEYFFLDSSYVSALAQFGVITFIIVFGIYEWAIWKMGERHMTVELAITTAMIISGIAEPFLFNMSFKNISLFFVGEIFFAEGGIIFAKNSNMLKGRHIMLLSSKDRDVSMKCKLQSAISGIASKEYENPISDRIVRFIVGCIAVVPFVISMSLGVRNFLTKFCSVLTFRGMGRLEGLRAFITWFLVGWAAVYFIQRILSSRKKG